METASGRFRFLDAGWLFSGLKPRHCKGARSLDGRRLQRPNARYRECMGDKSRKEVQKKAGQKRVKDDAAARQKREMTEAQHHPTSGHTATASHPTTSDERGPPRPQADQSPGEGHRDEPEERQGG